MTKSLTIPGLDLAVVPEVVDEVRQFPVVGDSLKCDGVGSGDILLLLVDDLVQDVDEAGEREEHPDTSSSVCLHLH